MINYKYTDTYGQDSRVRVPYKRNYVCRHFIHQESRRVLFIFNTVTGETACCHPPPPRPPPADPAAHTPAARRPRPPPAADTPAVYTVDISR
ncbi:hypothetical protein EVAR_45492_1 [Eumeta japonica]|uniref:Uncharacterized protein n=1 Tax=Eumeta variegata TaxID=151549 RepID=A0A4C1WDP1_EUMVA|nr:hypothetical protein EVAR_45492_1 [Eumeta japonica]